MRLEHTVDSLGMRKQALQLDAPADRAGIERAEGVKRVHEEPLLKCIEFSRCPGKATTRVAPTSGSAEEQRRNAVLH